MPSASPRLRLAEIGALSFEAPDEVRFPALRLAREALAAGGAAPATLNAANEIAVASFLAGRIGFLDIARIVEETLAGMDNHQPSTLADVVAIDADGRRRAQELVLGCQSVKACSA
jgi:1-deoxy-D-xylulose-5-phosphate reductoisomerase